MTASEKLTQPQSKDDLGRQLRSASPAIKRPASVMGAQDREEHLTDVEMNEVSGGGFTPVNPDTQTSSDKKAKQQDTGQRHLDRESSESVPHASDPAAASQHAPSEYSSASDSLLTTPSNNSTAATSLASNARGSAQLPSYDEQVSKVITLIQRTLEEGQKGYVVATKWLQRVQARSSMGVEGQKVDKVATEGEIGPVNNVDITMVIEDSGKLLDEAGEKFVPLRPGLTHGEEYQILPQEAWDLVMSWYGLAPESPVITRYAHDFSEGDAAGTNVTWELQPPIFSFLKVPSEITAQTQRERDLPPPRMLASKKQPFMQWLRQAKKLVQIDTNTKVRVWRILGPLKSSTASGMLTPAASRSASPAPGAEIIASAGDRMLLDVNTFAALTLGEHREQLELKDQTADPKYNGSLTLAIAGLGRDDVIVLEEQKGGPGGGEWPSEVVKGPLGKTLNTKSKGLTPSGRSSPAPGMMTRGRQRKDGRPRGITGLSNLGNTCYMNSALQCIRSVEELTQYFLHDQWKRDLNPSNPLGHHGEVAKAYANLLKQIYDEALTSTSPSKFKAIIGKYGSSFSGYQQQDSQEFLLFLLDGLQEDLNRIQKKPYIEKPDSTDEMVHNHEVLKAFADKNWDDYKARNDSVITDLFAGMYKSTVTCPVCQKVSIIFDPFNNLTLQLPIENNWSKEILYFPLHERPYRVDVDIDKHSSIKSLKEFVSRRVNVDVELLLVAESYKNKIYKIFDNPVVISEANIQSADIICVYELDSVPTNYNPNKVKKHGGIFSSYKEPEDDLVEATSPQADSLLVPVYHRLVKTAGARTASKPFFGQPTYVVVDRESNKSFDGILKKVLGNVAGMTTKKILDDDSITGTGVATPEGSDTMVMTDDASSSGSNLPQAASVQGEDGIVDVSMRDQSQAPEQNDTHTEQKTHPTLQPGTFVPPQLQNLFNVTVATTGEGIPTGWNSINEHNEYEAVLTRVRKTVTHRPAHSKRPLSVVNGDSGSVTSEDDLQEIEQDEATPGSGESSNASSPPDMSQSVDGSDSELPELRDVLKIKGRRKMTYSRKDRRHMNKKVQRRTPTIKSHAQPQPQHQAQPQRNGEGLILPGEAIVLDWSNEAFDALFGGTEDDDEEMRGAPTWKNVSLYQDDELIAKRARRTSRKKNGISLEDCLNEFGKSETLSENNAWYCPRCKEHRRADKMFELWKAPDILVMHLKRFSSNRNFRDKLEVRVEYPTEGLDLSSMVRDQADGKSLIYDLIAVDNHYGGLGGGHYTAFAKNFFNQGWYEYNDSHVSGKSDHRSVVTSAAYLLFYRRRSDHPLGGPALERLLDDANAADADSEAHRGSRDVSPVSGEGQRLGGSSHNGSSSAFPAGVTHLVGDGGPAIKQNRGLTPEEGNLPNLIGPLNNERLPGYTATPSEDEQTMQVEDEAISLSYDPYHESTGWGFDRLTNQRMTVPSEDEDMFGGSEKGSSNDSTKVEEPASPSQHLIDDSEMEQMIFSDGLQHDEYARGSRETAPPPDFIPSGQDEEDYDLPVVEIKAGGDGDMVVEQASQK